MKEIVKTTFLVAILVGVFFMANARTNSFSYRLATTSRTLQTLLETIGESFASLPLVHAPALEGEKEETVNFLILGVTGPGHIAPDLTDTILILSLMPEKRKGLVTGIPRDLLVKIPGTHTETKINALYATAANRKALPVRQAGQSAKRSADEFDADTELIRQKVEEITGLPIHYSALINVAALRGLVDALGGIQLYVEKSIADSRFPTPGGGIMRFELEPGWRYLDGDSAEKYARTRHGPDGDFGRMKRQIQVIEALEAKAKGLHIVKNFQRLLALYQELSKNIQTDLSVNELRRLWEIGQDMNLKNVSYLILDSHGARIGGNKKEQELPLLTGGSVPLGGSTASALWPKKGMFEYSEIQIRIACELEQAHGCK